MYSTSASCKIRGDSSGIKPGYTQDFQGLIWPRRTNADTQTRRRRASAPPRDLILPEIPRLVGQLEIRRHDPALVAELVGDLPPHAHLVARRIEHHARIQV